VKILLRLQRWLRLVNRVAAATAAMAILFSCFAVSYAVLLRSMRISASWQLEAAVFLMIYAAFVGAAYTHETGGQINIPFIDHFLGPRARYWHRLAIDMASLALFGLLLWSGARRAWHAWDMGWTSETIWGPPLWLPYAAVPLGAALMIANLLVDVGLRLADARQVAGE
jgi:TRAP-type C4-dicarboxylate transport system permease small subunit